MSDVFWNQTTPSVPPAQIPAAFIPIRIQGAAPDGSQDTFAQTPLANAIGGAPGTSAYQQWLLAGNTGSTADFLSSLKGQSAYQLWLAAGNTGDPQAFIQFLMGAPGPVGPTGQTGPIGQTGPAGQSAYQVWLAAGNTGTPQQFFRAIANLSPDGSTVSWAALTQSLNAAGYLGTLDQTPPSAADNLAAFQIYQHGWPSSIGDSMYAYLKTLLGLTDAQLTGIYNTVP